MTPPADSSTPQRKFWFPAKRYGWGWGPPTAWQGWVFLAGWAAALFGGGLRWAHRPGIMIAFAVAMVGIMIAVGYAKGEPPRWRWGDRDR